MRSCTCLYHQFSFYKSSFFEPPLFMTGILPIRRKKREKSIETKNIYQGIQQKASQKTLVNMHWVYMYIYTQALVIGPINPLLD